MNRDAMDKAWFTPSPLTPLPSPRPDLEDPEDEEGIRESIRYIESLIQDLHSKGIPLNRIVVGGFSQGCAISLVVNLVSKYAGELGGVLGVAGHLPFSDRIAGLRLEASLPEQVGSTPIFYARGARDMLVPRRFFDLCIEKLRELGLPEDLLQAQQYEGMGHSLNGSVLRDACSWLEKVVPALE